MIPPNTGLRMARLRRFSYLLPAANQHTASTSLHPQSYCVRFASSHYRSGLPFSSRFGLGCRNISISNAVSSSFGAHYGAGPEKSGISLSWKVCAFQPGLAANRGGRELGPTQPSLRSPAAIMITCSNSPVEGSGMPNHYAGDLPLKPTSPPVPPLSSS